MGRPWRWAPQLWALGAIVTLSALPTLAAFQENHRPWAEYEKAGWLVTGVIGGFNSLPIKHQLIDHTPEDVNILLYAQYHVDRRLAQTYYGRHIASGRVQVVDFMLVGEGFWTRDVMPIPVVLQGPQSNRFGLVGAKHSLYYEPDQMVAEYFEVPLVEHQIEFEGGNFTASHLGDCLIVDAFREQQISDAHFEHYYGCTRVIRFPHLKDIGHIDERVKLVDGRLALTDTVSYQQILEDYGYEVKMVPALKEPYRNYLNSTILNGTVFVPTFGNQATDETALQIYRSTGRFTKVIPVPSEDLVDEGTGGIHCITASFPPTPWLSFPKKNP